MDGIEQNTSVMLDNAGADGQEQSHSDTDTVTDINIQPTMVIRGATISRQEILLDEGTTCNNNTYCTTLNECPDTSTSKESVERCRTQAEQESGTTCGPPAEELYPGKTYYLFSDSCSGQNRNRYIVACLLYTVTTLNIDNIHHVFFEPGHSFMEVDSVHARIEKCGQKLNIYDPSGWYTVVKMASKNGNYAVHEMDQEGIYDLRKLEENMFKKILVDNLKNPVSLMKVKRFLFRKNEPDRVYFSYNYEIPNNLYFCVKNTEFNKITLSKAYNGPLEITKDKYDDLQFLCEAKIIPSQYRSFYDSLNTRVVKRNNTASPKLKNKKQKLTTSTVNTKKSRKEPVNICETGKRFTMSTSTKLRKTTSLRRKLFSP